MNNSERLHNQGSEQRSMTPELKLSMELWGTCEKLLQERGKSKIDCHELLYQIIQPTGILRTLLTRTMPQNLVRSSVVELKKDKSSGSNVEITCNGTNPSKTNSIEVYLQDMQDNLSCELDDESKLDHGALLMLRRQKRGKVMDGFDKNAPTRNNSMGIRLATMRELEAFLRYIQRCSPIEHK